MNMEWDEFDSFYSFLLSLGMSSRTAGWYLSALYKLLSRLEYDKKEEHLMRFVHRRRDDLQSSASTKREISLVNHLMQWCEHVPAQHTIAVPRLPWKKRLVNQC